MDKHSEMRKRRLNSYGHIKRMEPSRFAKTVIVEFYENLNKAKIVSVKFISEIREEDLNAVQTDITDKNTLRHNFFDRKVGQMDKRKKTGTVLSVLSKRALSDKMQQV